MSKNMFDSEVELGKFLGSFDMIPYAFGAILQTSSTFKIHTSPSGVQVLAFNCSDGYTDWEFKLVSSENQKVDFISTKVNPKFFINNVSVDLFEHLLVNISEIQNQLKADIPLVVTGRGLGGYLAILFTLWKQNDIDLEESKESKVTKRPICITFGTPLIGNVHLQKAISERPQWKSCFLNVVAKKDLYASFLSSKGSEYKPFGTFLFCTESGAHSAFEDQEAIMAVLESMASSNADNLVAYDYGNVLSLMRRKVLYRGVSEFGNSNVNSLTAGIRLQFREVGVLDDISNDLIGKVAKNKEKLIKSKKNVYEPTKKLNEMKISLTYMEWYMKKRKPKGGYVDSYKNPESKEEIESQQLIVKHQRILNQYWKKFVEEKDLMPQKEGGKLRKRWLFGGTSYRRIVEPLDIAEYYKNGNTNYIKNGREHFKHYVLLEKWSNEVKIDQSRDRKKKAASLNEDSCFWAHVEEALILWRALKNGGSSINVVDIEQNLAKFEAYVMGAIEDFSVSPDIFEEGTSLMKWWREYDTYKGTSNATKGFEYLTNNSG